MDVEGGDVRGLIDPDSGRQPLKVTKWQWKILSVADGSWKKLVDDGIL